MNESLPESTLDEILSQSVLKSSPPTSLSLTMIQRVGIESTASFIAQQQLNNARKAFLAPGSLPATHDFRKRANIANGTLLPTQPKGTPRKAYEPSKIPKPRSRKYKEDAVYFLQRQRLVNMWNGKWTKKDDWSAWDASKEKMEKQFCNYRLMEQPVSKERKEKEYQKREKKRKREQERSEVEPVSKKRCCGKTVQARRPFPLPTEVLALTPPDGIRMERLMEAFYKCEGYDTERFCVMLHRIGNLNKYTKMFSKGKEVMGHGVQKSFTFTGSVGDVPIGPALLKLSPVNACIKDARIEVF